MKKFFKNANERLRQSWRNLMDSKEKKMSEGASELTKTRTVAHKDQWRRGQGHENQHGHHKASNRKTNRHG